MYVFRINLKEKLPIVLIAICILRIIMNIPIVLSVFSLGNHFYYFSVLAPIIELLGIAIVIFTFRKIEEWVIVAFSYLILLYFFLVQLSSLVYRSISWPGFSIFSKELLFGNLFVMVLLALLILTYEKGSLKELFVKK